MGVISRLDAVNHMLLMAGESLVSDLEGNSGMDTEVAEFILEEFTRDFQLRGIANNSYCRKERLTTKGRLRLPANTISAELTSYHTNNDGWKLVGLVKGDPDKYLFNVTEQTYEWDSGEDYYIEIIHTIQWSDMDTPVQRGILSAAARQYQMVTQGDGDTDVYLQGLEALHTTGAKASILDDKQRNIFNSGTSKLQAILNRRLGTNDPARFRFWRTVGD
tara:strand:- start:440 stop:1096 length:657 start_codon:yes stop_codon:yes gene_type:complete